MNRGSNQHITRFVLEMLASMRPRFMNRGSAWSIVTVALSCAASMRPRFMNRGSNLPEDEQEWEAFVLQ